MKKLSIKHFNKKISGLFLSVLIVFFFNCILFSIGFGSFLSGYVFADMSSIEEPPVSQSAHSATTFSGCTPKSYSTSIFLPTPSSSPVPATIPPTPSPTPEPTKIPDTGILSKRFAGIFTQDEILTENSYSSPDMVYSWYKVTDESSFSGIVTYFVADIYVNDVTLLKTGFSSGSFKKMAYHPMDEICTSVDAVLAISGDFARFRDTGLVIRNGEVCRTKLDNTRDVGVLYKDGTFKTYLAKHVPLKDILASDPWQCWCFGPELLDEDGHAKERFNTNVSILNPRAVFGYYEPGHYCFVVVDGRDEKYSIGVTMQELSQLMESLGCKGAINLDGGSTAQMAWQSVTLNDPFKDRLLHDIIYLSRSDCVSNNG